MDRLRNLALVAHGGAGKTSLAEAMLYAAGAIERLGRTDEGNTVMDWEPEEIRRRVSISTSVAPVEWRDHKLNLLDTPGYFDFVGEVKAALRVVESALIVVDAVAGVEVGTELVWRHAAEAGVARAVVVSRMDRENANWSKALAGLEEAFGRAVLPIQIPIGQEAGFRGVVDVLGQRALVGGLRDVKEEPVPAELESQVAELRERIAEAAAEADDELTLKYLEGEPLTDEEIRRGLRAAVAAGKVVPVLCASGVKGPGVRALLDVIVDFLPSPADAGAAVGRDPRTDREVRREPREDGPLAALVFKTISDPFVGRMTLFRVYSGVLRPDSQVYNASRGKTERVGSVYSLRGKQQEAVSEVGPGDIGMVAKLQFTGTFDTLADEQNPVVLPAPPMPEPVYSVAVHPRSRGDEEKISSGLQRLAEEDPTVKVERNPVTAETIVSGMGEMHVDVMMERMKRKFGVEATVTTPKVAYKETIRGTARAEHKHKKQTGGHGQYGHVIIELEPLLDEGKDYEFVDKIVQGRVPQQYRPAVDKGIRETMAEGVLAGYPVQGVRVTLLDGSYHEVDSSEMAFKIAASQAFKKGFMSARPILLEPILNVEVSVPESYMGDIIGDLNKKRGRILGMEPGPDGTQIIRAQVPQAEMFKYAIDLRSITQGRGTFKAVFDHYEEVPAPIAQPIIEAAQKAAEAE
ncbi:elongation factor G [Caldinitratiruptor microaerophilus]|uniref:elongation factor G n=1 Tax=Caldinitratiruptor microaerophilus TaxID=671077 RepID=UPI0022310D4E|nr:elongation factor G [Caldinitratiruptor microaerophilus]